MQKVEFRNNILKEQISNPRYFSLFLRNAVLMEHTTTIIHFFPSGFRRLHWFIWKAVYLTKRKLHQHRQMQKFKTCLSLMVPQVLDKPPRSYLLWGGVEPEESTFFSSLLLFLLASCLENSRQLQQRIFCTISCFIILCCFNLPREIVKKCENIDLIIISATLT